MKAINFKNQEKSSEKNFVEMNKEELEAIVGGQWVFYLDETGTLVLTKK